jgi:hypothetical protein
MRDVVDIEHRIYAVRGLKVLLDADLAILYGVSTKQLNQQVRRNARRFPADFMFQVTTEEADGLRSQIVTSNSALASDGWGRGGRRYRPLAFTEQGGAMLSSVLKSGRAIDVNIAIMRTFVRLRKYLTDHTELARKVTELERRYDGQFQAVFDTLRELMAPTPVVERKTIGLHAQIHPSPPPRRARIVRVRARR